jgi:hypothetical protein
MEGLFPNIFHGERSELREKYGFVIQQRPPISNLLLIIAE